MESLTKPPLSYEDGLNNWSRDAIYKNIRETIQIQAWTKTEELVILY